ETVAEVGPGLGVVDACAVVPDGLGLRHDRLLEERRRAERDGAQPVATYESRGDRPVVVRDARAAEAGSVHPPDAAEHRSGALGARRECRPREQAEPDRDRRDEAKPPAAEMETASTARHPSSLPTHISGVLDREPPRPTRLRALPSGC